MGGGSGDKIEPKSNRKRYTKKMNHGRLNQLFKRHVTAENKGSLNPDGPFGQIAIALKKKNSKTNRQYLKTIFGRNRVQISPSPTSLTKIDNDKLNGQVDYTSSVKETRRSSRNRKRLINDNLDCTAGTKHVRSQYCICNQKWESVDDCFMVECSKCFMWYHLSCLNLKPLKSCYG